MATPLVFDRETLVAPFALTPGDVVGVPNLEKQATGSIQNLKNVDETGTV